MAIAAAAAVVVVAALTPIKRTWIRTSAGAMGVCAIALFFIPGLAAPFRLVKWALWGLVLAAMAVRLSIDSQRPFPFIPQDRWIFMAAFGFTAWTLMVPWFSTAFAAVHVAAMVQGIMGFAFSWLVAAELSSQDFEERWLGLFILGAAGALLSVLVFFQAAGCRLPGFLPPDSVEFRVMGTLGNPNWTAAFLLPLPPLLLGVRSFLSKRKNASHFQAVCLFLAVFIAGATLATRSKAGVLALVSGLMTYVLLSESWNRRARHYALAGMLAGVSALALGLVHSGLLETLSWTRGRLLLWKICLMLAAEHPVSGVGHGGFQAAYPHILPKLIHGDATAYMPLHRVEFAYNDLLQTAAESGIFSALLLMVLVFLLIRRAMHNQDTLSRGVGAAVAALAVYGCFDSPLRLPGTLALACFFTGWLMAGKPDVDRITRKPEHRRPWLKPTVLSCLVILGVIQALRFSAAEIFWTRGTALLSQRAYPDAALNFKKALAFTPENAKLLSEAAQAFFLAKETDPALETVDRALTAGFSFEDLFLRQKIIRRMGKYFEYVETWKRMVADYPGLFTPHMELGRIYLDKGAWSKARKELETVLRIRQKNDDVNRAYHAEAEQLLAQIPTHDTHDFIKEKQPPLK